MKLNYKRVIFVGFAFFLITAFWQAYDTIVPKILTDKFGLPQAWSGAIMALDNVFALFLLPVFGAVSDKVNSKFGRRTPFIVIGAVCAAVLLVTLSIPDAAQLKNIESVTATEGEAYTEALGTIWEENPSVNDWRSDDLLAGKKPLQELISKEAFTAIPMQVFPFENRLVVMTLNGEQMLRLFSEIAKEGGEPISGARMEIIGYPDNPRCGRVRIGGKEIPTDKEEQLKREYRIATSDYLAQGNDGLTTLAEGYNKKEYTITLRDLMIEYIARHHKRTKGVTAHKDGRVKLIDPTDK